MAPKLQLQHKSEIRILAFGDSLTEGYANFGMNFHPYALSLKSTLQRINPKLKITISVEGQSGDCVLTALDGEFQNRLVNAISESEGGYDLVIILGGTNDLGHKLEEGTDGAVELFYEGLNPLYDYVLEEMKAALLLMTVPMRQIDTSDSLWGAKAKEAREHLNELILGWAEKQESDDTGRGRVFTMDLAKLVPFPKNQAAEHGAFDDEEDEDPRFGEGSLWSPDGLHMSEKGYDTMGEELAKVIAKLLSEDEVKATEEGESKS